MAINAHKMVAQYCTMFSNEIYEVNALDNEWYKAHKNRSAWVRKDLALNGLLYAKEARKILGSMLHADFDLPQKDKDKIFEALCLDASSRGTYDEMPQLPVLH